MKTSQELPPMANHKNGKPLTKTSDRDLVIMLLQFIGRHITYSSKGDIAESEWQVIQKAIQSTTAYELLKGFLAYSNLPWRVVWQEEGFSNQLVMFLNELQVDILEAMGWSIKHEGDHRAVISDGVLLTTEVVSGNLNQNDLPKEGAVDFNGKPFRLERYEYRDGWLVTFTLTNIASPSTETTGNLKDDLNVDYYDDEFVPAAEKML